MKTEEEIRLAIAAMERQSARKHRQGQKELFGNAVSMANALRWVVGDYSNGFDLVVDMEKEIQSIEEDIRRDPNPFDPSRVN